LKRAKAVPDSVPAMIAGPWLRSSNAQVTIIAGKASRPNSVKRVHALYITCSGASLQTPSPAWIWKVAWLMLNNRAPIVLLAGSRDYIIVLRFNRNVGSGLSQGGDANDQK
jgi:hypothetical protein